MSIVIKILAFIHASLEWVVKDGHEFLKELLSLLERAFKAKFAGA